MASLQSLSLNFSSSSCCSSSRRIDAAIYLPKLPKIQVSVPKLKPRTNLVDELNLRNINGFTKTEPIKKNVEEEPHNPTTSMEIFQLCAIMEAVADRVEMHKNIGDQRDNWNTLLLNSINMIVLTAATMAGVLATSGAGAPVLSLKLSSTLLFSAATGLLLVMNKIQPSQLTEEQRNATRLFKQLHSELQTALAIKSNPTREDVMDEMEKVLSIDRAYPLPLLGSMLEKFPETFESAVWWPKHKQQSKKKTQTRNNGWSEELEEEMREVLEVLKTKDSEDYMRLGNLALRLNRVLAISGPLLTGIAAVGSAFGGSWGATAAATAGALASVVSTFEHGGQVGMVVEMYRNSAGFFKLMEESIESALEEEDLEKRENGELFEMKVATKLGRSLSQLRELAMKSRFSHMEGIPVDEFGSKLF
ncbi:hypothetical protein HS088_TW21G00727 [Tripterygium wilfordii]|uniref:F-box protein n=1 Tax=Tripterygium wilfordii TaxID=458696 RepID=A0A7J7C350_TRIWF|nr:probable F-box protein At4g22030 [Tripterygium wilfordii]KAF5728579.1 hypothetical protein HS088_TW21G00727 [Tripterygium wilfordii]